MSYVYSVVNLLDGTQKIGSKQCVVLVQHYAGAPVTSSWRAGAKVLESTMITPGTAIATFVNDRYQSNERGNHAALFVRREGNCVWVMDQWLDDTSKPLVSTRPICSKGKHKDGSYRDPSNNADAFSIIE
jgi:hypothetical protein